MIRWLRLVMDPGRLAEVLLAAWLPTALIALAHVFTNDGWPDPRELRLGLPALLLAAFGWGVYRVYQSHPLARPGYADWLARSPWAAGQPLPDGPVHLVLQDVVVLVPFAGPAWAVFGDAAAVLLLKLFAVGYLAWLGLLLAFTGPRLFAYLVLAGTAGLVDLDDPVQLLATAAGVYVVGLVGLRHSLDRFPWDVTLSQSARAAKAEATQTGWPFARLGPAPPPERFPRWEAAAVAATAGWWVFALADVAGRWGQRRGDPELAAGFVLLVLGYGTLFVAIGRLNRYLNGYSSPLSLLGRIATGRLVIPRFDVVYVAPLLAGAAAVGVPLLGHFRFGLPVPVCGGLAIAATLFALIGVGPSRARWTLASRARLVPTPQEKVAAAAGGRPQAVSIR